MSITVAKRVVNEPLKAARFVRAALVGCDFPLCDKALELLVNLQSSNYQCKHNAIRYIQKESPSGWKTDGQTFYCQRHAELKGMR